MNVGRRLLLLMVRLRTNEVAAAFVSPTERGNFVRTRCSMAAPAVDGERNHHDLTSLITKECQSHVMCSEIFFYYASNMVGICLRALYNQTRGHVMN